MLKEMVEIVTIVMLGSTGVGKTAYIHRMFRRTMSATYPTIKVELKTHTMRLDGRVVEFRIWDCPGRNHHLLIDLYTQAKVIFLMYDVTDRYSYTQATSTFLNLIRTYCRPTTMVTLIGTKIDQLTQRQVSTTEAYTFALSERLYFQEASSLTGAETDYIQYTISPTPIRTSPTPIRTPPHLDHPTPTRFQHLSPYQ